MGMVFPKIGPRIPGVLNHILEGRISRNSSQPARIRLFQPYSPVIAVLVPRQDPGLNTRPSAPRNRPARDRRRAGGSTGGNSRASTRTPAVGTWDWSSRGWTSLNAHQGDVGSGPSSFAWQIAQIATCCPPQGNMVTAGWPQRPQVLLAKRRPFCSSARWERSTSVSATKHHSL